MEGRSESSDPTRILVGVNESSIKGYPHASISSRGAFEWTVEKIIRTNTSGFKLLFLHVQVPDEDGFHDMDSIFASPEDFQEMQRRDKIRGIHLLEYFVRRCHQIGIEEIICSTVLHVVGDQDHSLGGACSEHALAKKVWFASGVLTEHVREEMKNSWLEKDLRSIFNIHRWPPDVSSLIFGLEPVHDRAHMCLDLAYVPCEAWIKKGDPKEVICSEVKRVRPDLLVVGNRGLGPFQRVFVGTVSEFCVKHVDCPVITIKRKAEEAPEDPVDD